MREVINTHKKKEEKSHRSVTEAINGSKPFLTEPIQNGMGSVNFPDSYIFNADYHL